MKVSTEYADVPNEHFSFRAIHTSSYLKIQRTPQYGSGGAAGAGGVRRLDQKCRRFSESTVLSERRRLLA